MVNQLTFDSSVCSGEQTVNLACGYVSLNEITFVNEKIIVKIEARSGEIAFYDSEANQLLSAKVQPPAAGDERFSEVVCSVEGDRMKLAFPQYTYKDNYPHCDGESDRWTKTVSGFTYLCYDLKNNRLIK